MEISEQVKQVFDVLAEKFGVVIDWTSENVVPYIKDLIGRVLHYEVATSAVWMIVASAIVFAIVILFRYCIKQLWREIDEADTLLDDDEWVMITIAVGVVGGIIAALCAIVLVTQIFDIVQALTLPEMTVIQFVKSIT